MIRAYLRCSTEDQTVTSQRHAMKNWQSLHGPESPTRWYEDEGFTGSNGDRPAYQRLLKEVKNGDTVLCYAVDRMTREGIVATLQLRQSFKAKGVKLVSVSEPWLSDDNPASEIVTAVLAWAAEQERRRIHARQRAGIQAAKEANGGRCPWGGRKPGTRITLTEEKEVLCKKLKGEGESVTSIARNLGIARKTVYQALARAK